MKLNWAEQQVKAASNYLGQITNGKKKARQISTVHESVKGQQKWLQQLYDAYTSITKCITALQAEKWVATKQLHDSGSILRALILVRKTFNSLVLKKQPDLIEETSFDENQQPNRLLGENHASWTQRLAKDAIPSIRCDLFSLMISGAFFLILP